VAATLDSGHDLSRSRTAGSTRPAGPSPGVGGVVVTADTRHRAEHLAGWAAFVPRGDCRMGSVVKKRRKRMAKKKHRKLLRKTRVQRRRLGK